MVHYFLRIQIHILNHSVDETSFMEWMESGKEANDCFGKLECVFDRETDVFQDNILIIFQSGSITVIGDKTVYRIEFQRC